MGECKVVLSASLFNRTYKHFTLTPLISSATMVREVCSKVRRSVFQGEKKCVPRLKEVCSKVKRSVLHGEKKCVPR